ncbi:MAG TPA: ATP-binding protein, partial [Polyangia bacterium]
QARNRGGFGLGLWIVRQIVDAHSGTIKLFSRPGVGSVFGVDLPTGLDPPRPVANNIVLLISAQATVRESFRQAARAVGIRGITAAGLADAEALTNFGVAPRLLLAAGTPEPQEDLRGSAAFSHVPIEAVDESALSAPELRRLLDKHCPDVVAALSEHTSRADLPNSR